MQHTSKPESNAEFTHWLKHTRLSPGVIRTFHRTENVNIDALKLASEEYRVCSARADELSRLVWQSFIGVLALAGAAAAAVLRLVPSQPKTQTSESLAANLLSAPTGLLAVLTAIVVIAILAWWRVIARKWADQQSALYERLNALEYFLGFRTNAQFARVDTKVEQAGHKPIKISVLRDYMAQVLTVWWSALAGYVSYEWFASICERTEAAVAAAAATVLCLLLVSVLLSRQANARTSSRSLDLGLELFSLEGALMSPPKRQRRRVRVHERSPRSAAREA